MGRIRTFDLTKEQVDYLKDNIHLSTYVLAKTFNCNQPTLFRWMQRNGYSKPTVEIEDNKTEYFDFNNFFKQYAY